MAKPVSALLSLIDSQGFAIERNLLSDEQVLKTRDALFDLQANRVERPGELGVLRLMMDEDPFFLYLFEIPRLLEIVDATVGNTAILHTQNGFVLPSLDSTPEVFQNSWHQDFPRVLNGYRASINILIALDPFTKESGATMVVPGSHQRPMPTTYQAIPVECNPGDAIVFDSTLWHCAGVNRSGRDRCAINNQFTKAWIKQQLDYPRALDWLETDLPERTKQLLGFHSRVPASLAQYYHVPRYYRAGQG